MIRWLVTGFGLGLAAGFAASLLHGRRVEPATGYVAPAPAYGQHAVPEVDVRSYPAGSTDPVAAGSRSTPVGASMSGGR
jgi:hypothetical protein